MAYQEELDLVLKDIGEVTLSDFFAVRLSIKSYDGKTPKVAMTRLFNNKDGGRVSEKTMGRFSREELEVLAKALTKVAGDESVWTYKG